MGLIRTQSIHRLARARGNPDFRHCGNQRNEALSAMATLLPSLLGRTEWLGGERERRETPAGPVPAALAGGGAQEDEEDDGFTEYFSQRMGGAGMEMSGSDDKAGWVIKGGAMDGRGYGEAKIEAGEAWRGMSEEQRAMYRRKRPAAVPTSAPASAPDAGAVARAAGSAGMAAAAGLAGGPMASAASITGGSAPARMSLATPQQAPKRPAALAR